MTSVQKPKEVGETKENIDNKDLGNVSEPIEEEPLQDPSVGSDNQDVVVEDVSNDVYTKLHSDEIQDIMDFEVDGEQFKIQRHYFTNGKL